MQPGQTLRIVKLVTYHTSTGVPAEELADRCNRTLDRAMDDGPATIVEEQRAWLDEFWAASDVEIRGDDAGQQAVRWNIFQLAQASAQTQEHGIAAKGVTGGGYEGHYFWDTETYVVPFLAYTSPERARKALRFRWRQLPQARQRAVELNQAGALYPWRTITGEEASAYYAAGTAQYHINAAIAFALKRYLDASGDIAFLANEAAEMLVETARLWEDLGFFATNGEEVFRIHGVTGPDEYTTVVNDNFYTNVMAPLQHALRGACHRLAAGVGPRRLRRAGPSRRPPGRGDQAVGAGRPTRCTCPTTRRSASTRRTTRSSASSRGTSPTRRPTSTRCCCTSTRS